MNKPATGVPWLKVTHFLDRWVVFDKDKELSYFTVSSSSVLFEADTFDECIAWIDRQRGSQGGEP